MVRHDAAMKLVCAGTCQGKKMGNTFDMDTPALLVDADILERNIQATAELCRSHGKRLRPHIKTHKTAEIARMQIAAGACGLTAAKVSEAEAFANAGLNDFFIANEIVGKLKLMRLSNLVKRCRVRVAADSVEVAAGYAEAMSWAKLTLDVMIEVDTGLGRAGTRTPEETQALARMIADEPALNLVGLFTHEGHLYRVPSEEREAAVQNVIKTLEAHRQAVESWGIAVSEVSVGSTPGQELMAAQSLPTELRPGNYVFRDRVQVRMGASREDCALSVLATVVSVRSDGRVIVDAGSKTLAGDLLSDGSVGEIIGRSDLRFAGMSEEHGHLQADGAPNLRVGDKVRILPNHACTCVNLHRKMYVHRGEEAIELYHIIAGGKIQ
jgi:D-serine deaminase-like pyridoxal phosphate-dependent protein